MMKYLAISLGCGLAFSLAACSPDQSNAEAQTNENRPGQNQDGQPRTPPEFVFAACADKALEAACSFEAPTGETRSGTCQNRRGQDRIVCAVERPDGQGQGGAGAMGAGAMGAGAMGAGAMGAGAMGMAPLPEGE